MSKFKIVYSVDDEILKKLIALDGLVFSGEDIGVFNRCKEWLKINGDIYTVLMCNKEVIGYINFMPITAEAYNKIKRGCLKDYEIEVNQIVKFEQGIPLKCLFTSIVVSPEYQTGLGLNLLWKGFINKLKSQNLIISSVIMDCVTEMGEKCAIKYLNAKFITSSQNGKIYEGLMDGLK
jgi:hypothetical protein